MYNELRQLTLIGSKEMGVRQPRYSKEEFTRRGNDLYEKTIRAQVESDNCGKFVAVDIETGAWEMDEDPLVACRRLISAIPDCQTWLVRIGSAYVHRLGGPRQKTIT